MKSKILSIIVILLIATTSELLAQPYYFIVPGTISYRLDGTTAPAITDPLQLRRNSPGYYGYSRNPPGARTGFDSSPYLDFSFFTHPSDPNAYGPSNYPDIVQDGPPQPHVARIKEWLMNFRILFPPGFDPENPGTERLPLLVMMHGAGERGDCWNNSCYSTSGDYANLWNNDHNLVHGGNQHLIARNNGRFPGIIVFPQNRNGWVSGPEGNEYSSLWIVEVFLEQLMRDYPIDPLRVYMHGLSNGGIGTWKMANTRPDMFAAVAAMSGNALFKAYPQEGLQTPMESEDLAETLVPIPLWQFQGGRDTKPSPNSTGNVLRKLREGGGTPRYYLYPNLGHATWNTAYAEPDFFEWFLQYDKTHIHPFFGVTNVCEGDPINVKLAVSKGFVDYEWQKDINGTITDVDLSGASRKDYIFATELGKYRVRIKYNDYYTGTQPWSHWSDWFELGSRPRPNVQIVANGPTALPGLDVQYNVNISAITESTPINYTWYRDGNIFEQGEEVDNITTTYTKSEYHLVVTDENLCNSNPSNSIYVSRIPTSGSLPFAPTNLRVLPNTPASLNLFWDTNSTDELGFEIYRRVLGQTTWQWIKTTAPGVISYTDTGLTSNTTYCYAIRAYNANGASAALGGNGSICSTTDGDSEPPSPPQNFAFNNFNYFETRTNVVGELADVYLTVEPDKAHFSWDAATDDAGVDHYNVYNENGVLVGTTTETSIEITGLVAGATHGYYVTAVDGANNESEHSNGISLTNILDGMYYNLYKGGTWDVVRDYSNWALTAFDQTQLEIRETVAYAQYIPNDERDYFAYDFFGFLFIENNGNYDFSLQSDDGSQLYIGSAMVLNHDGLHGASTKTTTSPVSLTAGAHPITVKYFERTGGQYLQLNYRGPDTNGNWQEIPASQYRSFGTIPSITPPAAPSGLTATANGYEIDLSWAYSGSPAGVMFEVWRSTDNVNYQIVGNTAYGELTYTDADLAASTTYYYKINAFNANGSSNQVGPASATTGGDTQAPTNPTNLTVMGVTYSSVVLSWDESTDNVGVTEYVIYMNGNEKGTTAGKTASGASALATTSSRTFTATGLSSDTEYSFYVIARDGVGNSSGNSNTVLARTNEGGPLPVEMVSFDAYPGNGEVLLKWVTASELNNEKFLVERGTNASNFVAIGGLDGSGTTYTRNEYKWVDRQPLDLAYYRIKQVDFDGTTSYSKTIRVVLDKSNLEELTVYPNPTDDQNIYIRGFVPANSDKVSVRLIDVMGKTYLNTVSDPNEFLSGVKIEPTQTMPVGVYILVLTDGSQVTQKRIVIK
ncbi:fibronectin type III domain-containing protein [Fulvivirga sedimenti]|uniref:Fibronectin type III domain-containing protein n=1 Tax=Fulvivirga sedimenti TaxID=2879465 RepID=A0A9X1HXY4_9BACT|nr:fibronectin type III domain-containing protein [Fulvivirga sedimenti]MCA6078777.1 fibronectin type III domain-containing protein [Fulvivirga sedimenti]